MTLSEVRKDDVYMCVCVCVCEMYRCLPEALAGGTDKN